MPLDYRASIRDRCLVLTAGHGTGEYVIHPWPRPACRVVLEPDGSALPCPPPVGVLGTNAGSALGGRDLALTDDTGALAAFAGSVPPRVARALEPFRVLQWDLLVACSLSEAFIDLLLSNPALAWLWVWRSRTLGFCEEQAARLLAEQVNEAGTVGQRRLLGLMGLRGTKAAVKILRKCHPAALDESTGALLRALLRDSTNLARLRHATRIGKGLLSMTRNQRLLRSCSAAMLKEIGECPEELAAAPTIRSLEAHFELLDEIGTPLPRPFRSRADLARQHRELVHRFHEIRDGIALRVEETRRQPPPQPIRPRPAPPAAPPAAPEPAPVARKTAKNATRRQPREAPPPPIPGTAHIQPLTSQAMLRQEGLQQNNCVAGYWRRVLSGSLYIYRILAPERCTLAIRKGRDGRWRRSELEIAGNRHASVSMCRMVDEWLRTGLAPKPPEDPPPGDLWRISRPDH